MLNHCFIMGRLTRDPELRRIGSGIAVTSFTVAVDRDFTEKDSNERETDFIDCVAWRQTGEFVAKYFKKGSMIVVSGRLQVRSWTDKENNKRRSAEIVADTVYFGEAKRSDNGAAQPAPQGNPGGFNAPAYAPAAPAPQGNPAGYNAPGYAPAAPVPQGNPGGYNVPGSAPAAPMPAPQGGYRPADPTPGYYPDASGNPGYGMMNNEDGQLPF